MVLLTKSRISKSKENKNTDNFAKKTYKHLTLFSLETVNILKNGKFNIKH